MKDRVLGIFLFALAILLFCGVIVGLLTGLIEWLQVGKWESPSLLRFGYDAHLLKASWFLTTDWGWRVHEILDQIPLLLFSITTAPLFWWAGLRVVRR